MPGLNFAVARDSSNLINEVWFTMQGKSERVTELPTGTPFDIHAIYHATLNYIVERTPNPPAIVANWEVQICAICAAAQIAVMDYDVTQHPLPGIGESAGKELVLNNIYYWSNQPIVGSSDLSFIIYLIGSCASNLSTPNPSQLAQMPVQ